jgi:deoxyribodipyrimidine photo-lyase
MSHQRALVWLRRDLRIRDHAALYHACDESLTVVPVFVLSPELLRGERVGAAIVTFFFSALVGLRNRLRELGGDLVLLEGDFATELLCLAESLECDALYFNRDTDPAAIARDKQVGEAFEHAGKSVHSYVDQVYFAHNEVLQQKGKPYTVFTPYKRKWLAAYDEHPVHAFPSERALPSKLLDRAKLPQSRDVPTPEAYGHTPTPQFPRGDESSAKVLLKDFLGRKALSYQADRNTPALDGTSHISPHLRSGTIGIRTCVEAAVAARENASAMQRTQIDVWINELIWRDFYHQILMHFPHVATGPFDPRGVQIRWNDDEQGFRAWCEGKTGYPIVDAAMRQLNTLGWMHNRLRMIVASFLTKDLLINWQRGERYFEQHLADGDLAANNGGWQWSASTGTDSAPYFRVFNPITQSKTYDPDGSFIRSMIPELAHLNGKTIHEPWDHAPEYSKPIVNHAQARILALERFGTVLGPAVKS